MIEEREALLTQALQHNEHLGDVGGRQRRRRLVENEDARLARQRLGDLDHLPARQRQVFDQRHRMNVGRAGARQRLLGDPALRAPVDESEPRGGLLMAMLSATESSGTSDSSWKMQTMPARLAAAGESKATSAPSSVMRPASGLTTPDRILISVDLPAPFSPRMAWMRPAPMDEVAFSSARTPP